MKGLLGLAGFRFLAALGAAESTTFDWPWRWLAVVLIPGAWWAFAKVVIAIGLAYRNREARDG